MFEDEYNFSIENQRIFQVNDKNFCKDFKNYLAKFVKISHKKPLEII